MVRVTKKGGRTCKKEKKWEIFDPKGKKIFYGKSLEIIKSVIF